MKKWIAILLAAALALCAFVPALADEEVVYTIALDGDIVALDPVYAYDFTTNPVVNQITESLLTFDQDNQIVPLLAKSWEAVDPTTYVYQIREDVNFSDGTPMTMEDVLFSINRNLDPDVGSYLNWMFSSVESIEQTGDWELTVKLTQPSATWQYVFGTTAGHVISKAYYEENQALFGTPDGGLMGTGAFVFESWRSGQEIVLVKNENYWDKSMDVQVDKLVYKVIPEDITRITALQTGQVDCAFVLPADMLDMLAGNPDVTVEGIDTMGITYLAMNTQMAPFDEVNVRQAIYHAIDFEAIHANIIKSAGSIGTTVPHSESLYTIEPERWEEYVANAASYPYDVEKAKALLQDSSVPDGFSCTLITNEDSLRYLVCLAIQEYLAQVGIEVEVLKVSSDEHTVYQMGNILNDEGIRDYGMLIGGWESDYPDISGNIEPLYASYNAITGGANAAVYQNEEVDAFITAQAASTDPTERNDLMFQALDIITEEVPYIIVQYPIRNVAQNNAFTGFAMNGSWIWNLYFKTIAPAA